MEFGKKVLRGVVFIVAFAGLSYAGKTLVKYFDGVGYEPVSGLEE